MIAAGHACGMDADAVDALVYEYFVRTNLIGDYTLPTKSFIRGRATETGLKAVFAGRVVEELTKEFRCVSVDLLARSAVVHRNGRVSDALACSLRVPGLYPPYQLNNRLHIDGGVLDNLPGACPRRTGGSGRGSQHLLRRLSQERLEDAALRPATHSGTGATR